MDDPGSLAQHSVLTAVSSDLLQELTVNPGVSFTLDF